MQRPTHRILLIDDDAATVENVSHLLTSEGYDVLGETTGHAGLQAALHFAPDVALIELRLPDMSGLDVLRGMQATPAVCIMVTAVGSCRSAVEATRLGAFDYLEKPLVGDALLSIVRRATATHLSIDGAWPELAAPMAHSFTRWARVVVEAIASPSDPKTFREWARAVGVSTGALRNWCRMARLPARRSLLFARVLRAVVRQHGSSTPPEDLLNVVDRRTLAKLLALSGGTNGQLPGSLHEFLRHQMFINAQPAIAEIRCALASMSSQHGSRDSTVRHTDTSA